MFWKRLGSGVILLIIAIATMFYGGIPLAVVLYAISLIAFRELTKALKCGGEEKTLTALEWVGLAVIEFVECAMAAVFLLNRKYQPFYKWRFRAFRALPLLGDQAEALSSLLCSGNDPAEVERKTGGNVLRVENGQITEDR